MTDLARLTLLSGDPTARSFRSDGRSDQEYWLTHAPPWFILDVQGSHSLLPRFLALGGCRTIEAAVNLYKADDNQHLAAAFVLCNNRHYVSMYQYPDGTLRINNDVRGSSSDPSDATYADYMLVSVLFVQTTDTTLDQAPPELCFNKDNRCLAPACITFLMRIPRYWWEHLELIVPGLAHEPRLPLLAAVAHTRHFLALTDQTATETYKRLLQYDDTPFGRTAASPACLVTFHHELAALERAPFHIALESLQVVDKDSHRKAELQLGAYTLTLLLGPRYTPAVATTAYTDAVSGA